MARPRMIVVAGPPGSGKTRNFPVTAFGVDAFNIDDRCAQILGSYRAIPRDVRRAVAKECERFVLDHIEQARSFAVETTLRTTAATKRCWHNGEGLLRTCISLRQNRLRKTLLAYSSARRPAVTAHQNEKYARSITRASRTLPRQLTRSTVFASTTRLQGGRLHGLSRWHVRGASFVTGLRPAG